jgi:hypothetical protein
MEPLFMEKAKRQKAKVRAANGNGVVARSFAKRRSLPFVLFPCALCLAGCINTGSFLLPNFNQPIPGPGDVVVAWNPEVLSRPDPANRGAPTKGLGGRMYLFGEGSDCPLMGDGSVVVDLYEQAFPAEGTSAVPLEEWRIDRDTLKRLLRRDAVGWGYTLFLPWGTYRPDLTHVEIRLRYDPLKGAPLYAEPSSIVLQKVNVIASSGTGSRSGPEIRAVVK